MKMWTKDEMKKVLELWDKKTRDDICKELVITKNQLLYITSVFKKAGIKLPTKHHKGRIINLVRELAQEING